MFDQKTMNQFEKDKVRVLQIKELRFIRRYCNRCKYANSEDMIKDFKCKWWFDIPTIHCKSYSKRITPSKQDLQQFEGWRKELLEKIGQLKEHVETVKPYITKNRTDPNRIPIGRMYMLLCQIEPIADYYISRGYESECDAVDERNKKIVEAMKKYEHNLIQVPKEGL